MKKTLLIVMLYVCAVGLSQEKMISKSGKITFEASVASFEEVKAANTNVTFVLNPATGEIASLALMKGFRFKIALMEEHFNENYIESDLYPKAVFKGKIEGFDFQSLSVNPKDFIIKGKLELHGKSKDISTTVRINRSLSGVSISCCFSVNASDFNIEIPSLVKSKVSNKINIQVAAVLGSNRQ
ncbi:YceI family protein [Flavobacterium sp. Fl-318]|uniref:YceI family protein n=1 Tax=Flavobacterium cupriresistens TaxID=2893885 RepID=A0ABU4RHF6_9FLAO|nr:MULTISPECIES: YceI family protein [unclassified Flavobacterium]MDX6191997.1 YceI family protein [Flavobacterium sp. Fl-318]UFH44639.1 YceI family protein [Flavobacterium sp. F-323]